MKQASKVIWQKATSPSNCHPSPRRMQSSAACAGQAHSPTVGTRYVIMGRRMPLPVNDLDRANLSLTYGSSDPQDWALRFSRFLHSSPVCPNKDRRAHIRATSVAIVRRYGWSHKEGSCGYNNISAAIVSGLLTTPNVDKLKYCIKHCGHEDGKSSIKF